MLAPVVKSRLRYTYLSLCLLVGLCLWPAAVPPAYAQACNPAVFSEPRLYTTGAVRSLVVADFFGDGTLDIAAGYNTGAGGFGFLPGDNSGDFPTRYAFSGGRSVLSIAAIDVFGNGRLGLVLANGDNTSRGNATIIVDPFNINQQSIRLDWHELGVFSRTTSVAVADFNGDGRMDVVVTNSTFNAVYVALNQGAGVFGGKKVFSSGGLEPVSVKTGDFNGDGKVDLAVANTASTPGNVAILLGDGAGSFGAPTTYAVGSKPVAMVTADFNGDGRPDLAVVNNGSNTISLLLGDGAGGFAPSTNLSSGGTSPNSIAAADIGGDGKLDLVVVNSQGAGIVILNGDGTGNFNFSAAYDTGAPGPSAVSASDLNGDGRLDLVVGHETARRLSVMLNTCAAAQTPTVSFTAEASPVYENAGSATLTVRRSGPLNTAVTVNYRSYSDGATPGSDYTEITGALSFASGETTKTLTIPVLNDTEVESNDVIGVVLSAPTGGAILAIPATTYVVILDDDSCSYFIDRYQRVAPASGEMLTVNVTAREGCSWTAASQSGWISIASGGSGTGNGSVVINISANGSGQSRSGTVIIGEQMLSISQIALEGPTLIIRALSGTPSEGSGRATISVTRTGDVSAAASADYRTVDTDTFTLSCADTTNNQESAYARCDFATTVGRVEFAAGEAQKTITVPIIDDGHIEGVETFQVVFSNLTGASPGASASTTISIDDNELKPDAPNPVVNSIPFFVRQQYLDFLSREPEPNEPWTGVMNRCPNVNTPPPTVTDCDRIAVSGAFFGSPEFRLKGFYVFRFYKLAFNRLPQYSEIVSDMSFVAGATAEEVYARKAQLATGFTARPEFINTYGGMNNAQYVATLLGRYQLASVTTPDPAAPDGVTKITLSGDDLRSRLDGGTLTRAQVLRAVADSDEVGAREYNSTFVAVQYYGYLRRTPDESGYQAWLRVINQDPNNVRIMINGFLNSTEYRLRFGQP